MTLFIERRRPAFSSDLFLRVTLAWGVIAAMLVATNVFAIRDYAFPDPDDMLRLVQVRDFLAGQGWFDVTQHRAGETAMHWSRLVDLPIAGIILALRGLMGTPAAEMAALVAIPLLTLFVCLFLIGRIAWRLLGDEMAVFACLTFAFSVPVLEQLRPMRIDHHGWQIALVLAAMNGMISRSPRVGGWIVGSALATGLSISIEQAPITAMFMAVLAWRWIVDRAERQWLVSAMQALAVVSTGLFLATHGFESAAHCDAVSPVHLLMLTWAAVVVSVASALEPRPRFFVVGTLAVAALGALAIVSQIAPACTRGAFVAIDPLARTFWLDRISEGQPLWRQSAPVALQIVVPPLIALYASLRLAGQSGGWLRRWWGEYAVILGSAFIVSLFVARVGAVAGALATLPLGWQLLRWLRAVRHRSAPLKRALIYGGISVALVPAAPALLLVSSTPSLAEYAGPPVRSYGGGPECGISTAPLTLAALPDGTVLAPLDQASLVLRDTRHEVLATGHHRAPLMADVIRAFVSEPRTAQTIVLREGVDYIALCPTTAEPLNYAHERPAGLAARLIQGRAPGWLEPVAGKNDGWLVWRVRH